MIRILTFVAVLSTAAVVSVWIARAATVTSANDHPSTLQASQAANHQVLFTTSTGVSEGSTITLSFASAFDTSSISEDDVDIADDGVDLTTASSCSGSEQASVSVASDIITITICSGDGGTIAASSTVAIEIGTNATSSGTGTNRITNPTSSGNYYLSIGGTFGDSGSIVLPIGSDDSLSVTATVVFSGGGSGGGGGGGGTGEEETGADTEAPTISDIVVSGVTTSSATISWTTSEPATRILDYGLTTSFEFGSVSESGYYSTHTVTLTGLSEGETYYFQIRAEDLDGNAAVSDTQSFSTLDETAPVISDIEVVDITTMSARVTWETNEFADSTVSYGLTSSYTDLQSDASLTTSHSILLTDLSSGTLYHFQVLSTDASSNQASSEDLTFMTDEDEAPGNVSNLSIIEGDRQLTISWTNPDDVDLVGVWVLMCEGAYPSDPTDASCTTISTSLTTEVSVTDLENGTTYYFGVFAYDEAGQFASGALGQGTPQALEEEAPSEEPEEQESSGEDSVQTDETSGEETEDLTQEGEEAVTSTLPGACGDILCPQEPTSLTGQEGGLSTSDVLYLVADETIALMATDSGVIEVIPVSDLRVVVSGASLRSNVATMTLLVGEQMYLMAYDNDRDRYAADVTTPGEQTIHEVSVLVTYEDGSTDTVSSYLRVVAPGYVYQILDEEEMLVYTAHVTLFAYQDGEWIVWDGSPYDQFNPIQVSDDGTFSWYVPDGVYEVKISADGFASTSSGMLSVDNAIVNPHLRLLSISGEAGGAISERSEEILFGSPALIRLLAQPQELLATVRALEGVEEAAKISIPILAIIAGASLLSLSVGFDLLPFLQYLFTAPILFFWRRRRKEYGVVYNAISKVPVDLAVVRLFRLEDETVAARGRLVKSHVTDREGRYLFLAQPGIYRLTVSKIGFQFPTEYLKEQKTDGNYLDVYHGEIIQVTSNDAVITANIPLDPSQEAKYHEPASVHRRRFLRALQHALAIVGTVASIIFAVIQPTFWSIVMMVIQLLVYLFVRRLALARKPVSWGIVYDRDTGRPLSHVIARIFEPKYNKLLETQVTDGKGRYAFLLGQNQYYATFEKEGFRSTRIDPIDYSAVGTIQAFVEEVPLEADEIRSDAP